MLKALLLRWRVWRFVKRKERLLRSENPVMAFADDPRTGTQRLKPGETNEAAYRLLRDGKVQFKRLGDGREAAASEFDRLVFVEAWDPLSATVIGSHKQAFDDGLLGSFGVVLVTDPPHEGAWYRSVALLLNEGAPLRDAIAVIPFAAVRGADGALTFHEGLEGTRFGAPGH